MADRAFLPHGGTLELDVKDLFCVITVGATGAVSAATGKGITSVTRNSAGKYTILLADRYNALLYADAQVLHSTASDPTTVATVARLFSEAVNNATPTVVIQGYALAAGAAADFASGAKLYVRIVVRNSSVT